jgi:hypothetical protein
MDVSVHRAPGEDQHDGERDTWQNGPNDFGDAPAHRLWFTGRARGCADDGMENGDVADGAAGSSEPEHQVGEPKRHIDAKKTKERTTVKLTKWGAGV